MKKTILTIALALFSFTAFSLNIVKLEFATKQSTDEIIEARLDDKGELFIDVKAIRDSITLASYSKIIHLDTYSDLIQHITTLGLPNNTKQSEGEECEVKLYPFMRFDNLSVATTKFSSGQIQLTSPLKVVHTSQGCWMPKIISLNSIQDEQRALLLKSTIKSLALEIINKNLN